MDDFVISGVVVVPVHHAAIRSVVNGIAVRAAAWLCGDYQIATATPEGSTRFVKVVRRRGKGRKLSEACGAAVRKLERMLT